MLSVATRYFESNRVEQDEVTYTMPKMKSSSHQPGCHKCRIVFLASQTLLCFLQEQRQTNGRQSADGEIRAL